MFRLEFLSEDEVEVASGIGLASEDTIEAISPVNAEQTDHRQEDAGTNAERALHMPERQDNDDPDMHLITYDNYGKTLRGLLFCEQFVSLFSFQVHFRLTG